MSRRDELLNGVHTLNRKDINERETSEEAQKISRTFVEGKPDKRDSSTTGESGRGIPSDKSSEASNENGLEEILKAQVLSRSEALREVELEIADCEYRGRQLKTTAAKLKYDVQVATDMLGQCYGNDNTGSRKAKSPVPQTGPGLKVEAEKGDAP